MVDSYTITTRESWMSRIRGSFLGAIFGLILFFGSFVVLFTNEGNSVQRAQSLEEGARLVMSVDISPVDPINEDQLIHLTGKTNADGTLHDPLFGVMVADTLKLQRSVTMYQWKEQEHSETEELLGGETRTVTTYTYTKRWANSLINSNHFQYPEGHQNPYSMPISNQTMIAEPINLGDFILSKTFVARLNDYQPYPIATKTPTQLSQELQSQLGEKTIHLNFGNFYIGQNPNNPQIGDLRIIYEVVRPATISIIAKQTGSKLVPYTTKVGGNLGLLEYDSVTAENMFKNAQKENAFLTWILRLGGFLMMFIGLTLIFSILRVLAAVMPLLGQFVGGVSMLISLLIAIPLSLLTIALAWLYYRPLVGIGLLIIALGFFYLLKLVSQSSSQEKLIAETVVPDK
jgi:hypothetical protein